MMCKYINVQYVIAGHKSLHNVLKRWTTSSDGFHIRNPVGWQSLAARIAVLSTTTNNCKMN